MEKQLHIISTGKQTPNELINKVLQISNNIDFLHIRERTWTAKQHLETIDRLIEYGLSREKIVINDRVDVAIAAKVSTVQLASHSVDVSFVRSKFPSMKIGCSVHSKEEAVQKEKEGAHYLLYGHIFSTNSKKGMAPRGLDCLKEVVSSVHIPVVAIGGISPENMQPVFQSGAKGVAVLSGILLADDVKDAVKRYREKLHM